MNLKTAALLLAHFARRSTVECSPFITSNNNHYNDSKWLVVRGGETANPETVTTTVPTTVPTNVPTIPADPLLVQEEEEESSTSTSTSTLPDIDSLIFLPRKHGDGSETDPDQLPKRFLNMQKGNREKAKIAFEHHLEWRREHQVDDILKRPHPKFDMCKKIFPVYIPGLDRQNHIVVVQRVGLIDFKKGDEVGVTGDDLLMNYIYMVEYCWNILDPAPDAVMTTVMDLKGVRFKTISDGHIRGFLKKFVATMSNNYPNRSNKTLVINAPHWINTAYKLVKPLMRSSTREKISILNGGKVQDQMLIDILGADHVPRELLNDPTLLPSSGDANSDAGSTKHVLSDIEKEMRDLCVASLEQHGEIMMPVV
mmetsp:Transcript_10800/g.16176  ORF Transcript_10800/g.16176 Transcript_10800/m.16176 type:complete len:368 (+) Transcript_10800:82-1185(+)